MGPLPHGYKGHGVLWWSGTDAKQVGLPSIKTRGMQPGDVSNRQLHVQGQSCMRPFTKPLPAH